MGSYFSSIDNLVDKCIFQPPSVNEDFYKFKVFDTANSKHYMISSHDETFKISYVHFTPTKRVHDKCIVFSHGNGCDITGMFSYLLDVSQFYGCDVVCYDYPGYGISKDNTNRCSENGCYNALEYVINDVISRFRFKRENIALVGQSLGTGVVVDYVSKQKSWNSPIMLISPYKTIVRVMCDSSIVYPIDKFMTQDKIEKITCPVKIFHGDKDELIDIKHGRELYEMLENPKSEFTPLTGIGHNNILMHVTYGFVLTNH